MRKMMRKLTAVFTALVLTLGILFLPVPQTGYAAAAELSGIDVSKFQEAIDWQQVAQAGIKFAILRCCKIVHATGLREFDDRFEENYAGAKAAGIAVGCYMWTDAATLSEFSQDTAFFLSHIQGKSFEFPVFLDVESAERQEHLSPDVFMPPLLSALAQIEKAGHTAGIYANTAFFSECLNREQLRRQSYIIWEANYFNVPGGLPSPAGYDLSDGAAIWQYTGSGRVSGISTAVDRDVCYTYQFFHHTANLTEASLPSGTLAPQTDFTITGKISSNSVLRSVTGTISPVQAQNTPVQQVTIYPNAKSCSLEGYFSKKLDFSSLNAGNYVLNVTAVDSADQPITVVHMPFSVSAPVTTTVSSSQTTAGSEATSSTSSLTTTAAVTETTVHPAETTKRDTTSAAKETSSRISTAQTTEETTAAELQGNSERSPSGKMLQTIVKAEKIVGLRRLLRNLERWFIRLELERTPLYRIMMRCGNLVHRFFDVAYILTEIPGSGGLPAGDPQS